MEINVYAGAGKLQQVIEIGPHKLLADEPVAIGGEDTGPAPHDLLAASLGACTALTVTMYARHKNYPLDDVRVKVEHAQQADAYVFTRHIVYVGQLDEEQRARLTVIANKCPIHKVLSGAIQIVTHAA